MLTKNQIENIVNAKTLVLATADENNMPRCVIVMPSRIESEKIYLCDIQMEKTIDNLKQNNKCFLNVYIPDQNDLQYKIEGLAEIVSEGNVFNEIKNYEENENGLLDLGLEVRELIIVKIISVAESNG